MKEWLGRSYWLWRLYHELIADPVTLQRPTKDPFVYEFLGKTLGRVADIGCGPGVFTRYLCRHARHVCAADVDQKALSRTFARHLRVGNLAAVVMHANHLSFADSSFDTVLFLEVLEHLDDDRAALCELNRVLAPAGRMVLSIPIPPGELNEGEEWGHKREGYSLSEIGALLEITGFEVIRHAYALFKYSRLAVRLVRTWRNQFRLPAPCFIGWISYCDLLLDRQLRERGEYEPADLVILAKKRDN